MSVIRIPTSELSDFFIYYLAGVISSSDSEQKKELEKLFKFGGMRKFQVDNKARFLQRYRIFTNSLNDRQATRIEIVSDGFEGEITPDEKRPTVTKKIMRLLRRLTGTKNESLQEMILHEFVIEQDKLWESENLAEKYLT